MDRVQVAAEVIRRADIRSWAPSLTEAQRRDLQDNLEAGAVLFFPDLGFELPAGEKRYLSERWADEKSKNINLRPSEKVARGALASQADLVALTAMIARYAESSGQLVRALFPGYVPFIRRGGTSFRPCRAERPQAWRKDDTRLHVDAFPSNPNHGQRLLRVFTNVNPDGLPRVWRIGEPFPRFAEKFIAGTRRAFPGSAWLLFKLGITKSHRSPYDHLMLQLHDHVKADLDYQKNAPQQQIGFPPQSTWVVFSDQVLHAAMSGQFMFEQTFYVNPAAMSDSASSPLAVLERITGARLVRRSQNSAAVALSGSCGEL